MSIESDTALAAALRDPEEVLALILDPKRRGSLYPFFHRLRELSPVHPTEQATGKPAWVLTRYDDVRHALKHPDVRSDHRGVDVFDVGPAGRAFYEMQLDTLLFMPPDKHDRVRALISRAFTPRSVELREERIQEIVEQLLDRVKGNGKMDVVTTTCRVSTIGRRPRVDAARSARSTRSASGRARRPPTATGTTSWSSSSGTGRSPAST
jgi:cytochrome P450